MRPRGVDIPTQTCALILLVGRYFMKKMMKAKKTGGEILAVNEIFEKNPNTVKNYAIWLRYRSRTDQHNMYKEYRDMTINGAVSQMSAAR